MPANVGICRAVPSHLRKSIISITLLTASLALASTSAAQTPRTREGESNNSTDSAPTAEVPNQAQLGAAPGTQGILDREQELKDSIYAAVREFNAAQQGFGYPPMIDDAELSQSMLDRDFVAKLQDFLAANSNASDAPMPRALPIYVNRTGEVVDQYEQAPPTNPPTPSRHVRSLQPDEVWTDGPTRLSPLEWRINSGVGQVELIAETLSNGQTAIALVKAGPATTPPMTSTTTPTTTPTTTLTTKVSNVLDVPIYAQQTSMWCWATGGEMIMKFHGVEVPQCQQANEYYPKNLQDFTKWGIDCCGFLATSTTVDQRIVEGGLPQYQDYGFTHKVTDNPMSFDDIKAQIDANQPIGFGWFWKSATGIPGGGHYMVLTGYKTVAGAQMVKINDPWPNQTDKLSNPTDHTRWIAYSYWVESAKHRHALDHYDIKKQ